jgi:LPXTG-site transpeptidase (sortase) family protein
LLIGILYLNLKSMQFKEIFSVFVKKINKIFKKTKIVVARSAESVKEKYIDNQDGIGRTVLLFFKKHKKKIFLLLFAVSYVFFWSWYFGEKNVGLVDDQGLKNKQEKKSVVTKERRLGRKENKKEFSEEDLGSFWLEIDTDKVKIKAPIVNGIESDDLEKGLGRHRTSALPGEKGNMVISGHRWKFGNNPSYKIFEDLDELKEGDKVKVHYGSKVFEYEIVGEGGVVAPNKKGGKEILKKYDQPMLTLYTCTPKRTSFRRLYYRAKLVR